MFVFTITSNNIATIADFICMLPQMNFERSKCTIKKVILV